MEHRAAMCLDDEQDRLEDEKEDPEYPLHYGNSASTTANTRWMSRSNDLARVWMSGMATG